MPDGRANNGGHSTKAKGADKRKNQYRDAFKEVVTIDDFKVVVSKILEKAKNGDVRAGQELLNRLLPKPDQSIDLNLGNQLGTPPRIVWKEEEK